MVNRQSKAGAGKNDVLFWQRVLEAHSASGLTVRRFCENEGLAVWRFYYWRKKLRGAVKSPVVNQTPVKAESRFNPTFSLGW